MSSSTQALGGMHELPSKPRKRYWRRIGGTFLILSIIFHLLFFTGAAFYIIQILTPKKLTFKAGIISTNPDKKLNEHKVSAAKQRKSMSAPAPAKRVVTTGFSQIILPEMPAMPTNVVMPTQMVGMGGVGYGFGGGMGGNGNGSGGGDGYMAPFGTTTYHPGMLVGQYYDFKFTRNGQPSKDMKYAETILDFVKNGWHESVFSKLYKGPHKLYATQIFFPTIDTSEGPKEFGCPIPNNEGGKWVAVYRGTVCPPDSGTYYFVGAGDDDMIINFDGKEILNNCEHIEPDVPNTGEWHYGGLRNKFAKSQAVEVTAGQSYDIKILIGDDTPTKMMAMILYQKDGVNYQQGDGGPILPVFSVAPVTAPSPGAPRPSRRPGVEWQVHR